MENKIKMDSIINRRKIIIGIIVFVSTVVSILFVTISIIINQTQNKSTTFVQPLFSSTGKNWEEVFLFINYFILRSNK